ncbi:hypothetical protein HDV05_001156, partial [Chytridiales sp. JEL 0842]
RFSSARDAPATARETPTAELVHAGERSMASLRTLLAVCQVFSISAALYQMQGYIMPKSKDCFIPTPAEETNLLLADSPPVQDSTDGILWQLRRALWTNKPSALVWELYMALADKKLLTAGDYTCVLRIIAKDKSKSSTDRILAVVDDMLRLGHMPSPIEIKHVLQSKHMKMMHLDQLLALFAKHSVYLSEETYNLVLSHSQRLSKDSKASPVFKKMRHKRLLPSSEVFVNLIDGLVRKSDLAAAETILQNSTKTYSPRTLKYCFSTIIKQYVKMGDMQKALKQLETLVSLKILPDSSVLDAILKWISSNLTAKELDGEVLSKIANAYLSLGDKESAQQLVSQCGLLEDNSPKEMFESGISSTSQDPLSTANLHPFTDLANDPIIGKRIWEAAKDGDATKALSLFNTLDFAGFKPRSVHWSALIYAHSASNDPNSAISIFNEMQHNANPGSHTYACLIHGLLKSNELDTVDTLIQEMKSKRINIPAHIYCDIANYYIRTQNYTKSHQILSAMSQSGIPLSEVAYSILAKGVKTSESSGMSQLATLHNQAMKSENVTLDTIYFNTIMHSIRQTGFQSVWKIYSQMKQVGVQPDSYTFTTLLQSTSNSSFQSFTEVIEELDRSNIVPDARLNEQIRLGLVQWGFGVDSIVSMLKTEKKADPTFIKLVIQTLRQKPESVGLIKQVWNALEEIEYPIDGRMASSYLLELMGAGENDEARRTLGWVLAKGIRVPKSVECRLLDRS